MKSGGKRRSSQVPAQFLGFSLQTTRATVRLLTAQPGSFVSVEVLDDVAVKNSDGTVTAEQTKSATASNPLADRSPEWWKTIGNWVRSVEAGVLDPDVTSFELFVSKRLPGQLVRSFSDSTDHSAASAALARAKILLWGTPPRCAKRARLSTVLAPHVRTVFNAKGGVSSRVVERFSLVFGSGASHTDLANALSTKIISDEMIDVVANQMLGWVKTALDSSIEKGQPAAVSTDAFNQELGAFVRRYDRFAILNSFAPTAPKSALDTNDRGSTYIRQLDIIGADYDAKLRAANDFLRSSVDRSLWAAKGLVHQSSFDEFEEVLVRTWDAKKQAVAVQTTGQPADASGRLLYSECSQFQSPLEGRSVPPHFIPGCFHTLANSLTLGWHPDFRSALTLKASTEKDIPK